MKLALAMAAQGWACRSAARYLNSMEACSALKARPERAPGSFLKSHSREAQSTSLNGAALGWHYLVIPLAPSWRSVRARERRGSLFLAASLRRQRTPSLQWRISLCWSFLPAGNSCDNNTAAAAFGARRSRKNEFPPRRKFQRPARIEQPRRNAVVNHDIMTRSGDAGPVAARRTRMTAKRLPSARRSPALASRSGAVPAVSIYIPHNSDHERDEYNSNCYDRCHCEGSEHVDPIGRHGHTP